jgi:ribosomal protein S18 acetylase RimI-like enzyme
MVRGVSTIEIRAADDDESVSQVRLLFKEYASLLGVDLSFQDFARELAELPGAYVPPGGTLLLAFRDRRLAGCVAMRPFGKGTCEMKRLYVRHPFRGKGVGRRLAAAVIEKAHEAGYRRIQLDTLPWMDEAVALYRGLGFREIEPYRPNPIEGAIFMQLDLS